MVNKAREEILKTDREFSRASLEIGMAEAFVKFADDSARMLQNGTWPIQGKEAIRERMSGDSKATLQWEPYFVDVGASGDLGYTLGKWEHTSVDSAGNTQKAYGTYVSIWKRQADGSWKWVLDTGTTGPKPDDDKVDSPPDL
ncbi:MAG: DUF4440 domain-containing protein [Candidatus Zixiibacteriota bacterium]|nr:MAG: DUF4440 domain-containing protein [candidate division Zixibacteria bacterium]